jgi:bifunctional non-homologous end joining protein LigD
MSLDTYRQKRNFARTSEPRGRQSRRKGHEFVVQKHDARNLHYDFRLELDGVLLSWAVPKGPSLDPSVKRLAMQTEDHPLDYGSFEGVIPEGEYGGGTVLLWDRGTWEPEGDAQEMYRRGRLSFALHGEKLHGGFHLVRTAGGGKSGARRWLLFKSRDAEARPGSDAQVLEESPNSVTTGRDLDSIAEDPDHVWTSKASEKTGAEAPTKGRATKGRATNGQPTNGHSTNGHSTNGHSTNGRAARASAAQRVNGKPAKGAAPSMATLAKALARHPGAKRAELPEFITPELATLVPDAPGGEGWLHEIKLDGYRILVRFEGGHARLFSRRGNDWTPRLPSIASALGRLPIESGWLDGEVVVLDDQGVSNFQRLQNSMEAGRDVGCVYFAFDALFLDGYDVRGLPLTERKALLRSVLSQTKSERVRFGDHVEGNGPAFFERACNLGLEGIVSKRADAAYSSGRGRSWLKIKCLQQQEFVVGGYTEPAGSRKGLGALLVGVHEQGELRYAGKVGTGFSRASLAELRERLAPLECKAPAFANPPRARQGVHWVEPRLVAQIAFVERTQDGLIRHASFQGLREDKSAEEVHLEGAQPAGKGAEQRPRKKAAGASAKASSKAKGPSKAKAPSKAKTSSKAKTPAPIDLDFSRLEITHPDRILFPDQGITKRELMLYYARVAHWMLPHVIERPLMLVRCPEGAGQQCFHQKHPSRGMPRAVQTVSVPQKKGPEDNLMIRDVEGLLGLVQMGALEIHTWGSRKGHLDCPDQLVFDLDPDEGLPWARMLEAAHALRDQLGERGLTPFLRLTGGKGLHLVVPVEPRTPWDAAKAFTESIARGMADAEPSRYVATMTKQKRKGKIFIDYFRNGVGATAVCSYSTRARPGAPLAVPIDWDELDENIRPDRFTVKNIARRLASLSEDPWATFDEARAPIPT